MTFKSLSIGGAAAVLSWLLVTTSIAAASEPLAYDEPVVPPGQDELISTMLGRGAELPDGCKFAGGLSDGPLITGNYVCPSGHVAYRIVHPDNASDSAAQTERFAIMIERGAPPATLTDALARLFRGREADFEWLWLTSEDEAADADEAAGAEDTW